MPRIPNIVREKKVLDATGKSSGRLASEIAQILQGKHKPAYQAHIDMGDIVEVRNAAKMKVTGTKLDTKIYHRHSGHPGGITSTKLSTMMVTDPSKVLKMAVKNMIPMNTMRAPRLKRLTVHND
jgi:large subunit ribosomal protein L13